MKVEAPAKKPAPKGWRGNNPGNIRHGDPWEGMSKEQKDPRFVDFETPEHGVRALRKVLQTYQNKYDLNTVQDMISRWAPAKGKDPKTGAEYTNDPVSYAKFVAARMGIDPTEKFDIRNKTLARKMIDAMIDHEGTGPKAAEMDEAIRKGFDMAEPSPAEIMFPKQNPAPENVPRPIPRPEQPDMGAYMGVSLGGLAREAIRDSAGKLRQQMQEGQAGAQTREKGILPLQVLPDARYEEEI